jgi:hypothetical protein
MKEKKFLILDILETALRIWTGFFVFLYGIAKSVQFGGTQSFDVSIKDATGMELMWAFFGATEEYPLIIGGLQVLGSVLLVFNRTKLLGALLLTPIFINIILLDILYGVHFGALLNAIIFQSVFVFIIIQQRKRIIKVFRLLTIEKDRTVSFQLKMLKLVLATLLAIVFFFGFYKILAFF